MVSDKKIVTIDCRKIQNHLSEYDGLKLLQNLQGCFEESYLIVTCQRIVICAYVDHEIQLQLKADEILGQNKYDTHVSSQASATFLFRLASGLESKVLGEHEIQGQMIKWKTLCREHLTIGPVLDELIRQAIHCGKVVRTKTGIGSANVSYASLALSIVKEIFGKHDLPYLIIGTGSIATKIVQILKKKGIENIVVASHDLTRARNFTESYCGSPILIDNLSKAYRKATVIIGGTHGEVIFSHKYDKSERCPRHGFNNQDLSKLIIDFGSPANFPSLKNSFNYHGMESLTDRSVSNQQIRYNHLPFAEEEIFNEVQAFMKLHNERKLSKILGTYWKQLQNYQEEELDWLLPKLNEVSIKEKELIKSFAHRMIRRIAKTPLKNVREMAQNLNENKGKIDVFKDLIINTNRPENE